jgi:hypothetical protein
MTVALEKERAQQGGRLFNPGGAKSLDDVVTTAWGGLALRGTARCLVCGSTASQASEPDESGVAPAECPSCGSRLE